MRKKQDLIGNTYDMLTVISEAPERANNARYFHVVCSCGNKIEMHMSNLKKRWNTPKSCGCYRKHGKSDTRLYITWQNMHQRCSNPEKTGYKHYGGRGISICPEWKNFTTFLSWAESNGYQDHLTIDRIDNDGNYCPDNCEWITKAMQARKRRSLVQRIRPTNYIGICYFKRTNKWLAYIDVSKKRIHLGYHATDIDAALARDTYIINEGLQGYMMNGVL